MQVIAFGNKDEEGDCIAYLQSRGLTTKNQELLVCL